MCDLWFFYFSLVLFEFVIFLVSNKMFEEVLGSIFRFSECFIGRGKNIFFYEFFIEDNNVFVEVI